MSSCHTINTTVSIPNYCCLFCLQKHGSIQKLWVGYIVKKVSPPTTRPVHKCIELAKHLRKNHECSAYYSSNGISTWNRDINVSSSMLGGPTTHQLLHQPSSFGLSMTGNAPVVACHSQLPSSTTNSTPSPSVPITQSPHYHSNRHSH